MAAFCPEDVHPEDARDFRHAFADIADADNAERFAAQVKDGQFVQAEAAILPPASIHHGLMVGQEATHRCQHHGKGMLGDGRG